MRHRLAGKSRWVGRLWRRLGRRGAFLTFLCVLDCVYSYALMFPSKATRNTPTYAYLADIMPLWVWAAWWGITGVICGVYAFRRKDAVGYAAAMLLKAVWAGLFVAGSLFAGLDRGYLSTVIWGSFGLLLGLVATWPEAPPRETGLAAFPDAIITADADGIVTGWAGAAPAMFGWAEPDILGQPLTVLIPEEYQGAHVEALARLRAGEPPRLRGRPVEMTAVRRDGTVFPMQVIVGVHRVGDQCTYSAVVRDLGRQA